MEKFIATMVPRINKLTYGYDAYYLKFNAKDGYTYWIRYDLTKKQGRLKGEVWFIRFTKDKPEIYKKEEFEDVEIGETFVRIGSSYLYNTSAEGKIGDISWKISWEPLVGEIWYYEERWYKSKLLPTKATAPYPSAKVVGEVKIGDETFTIEESPGELGHHWGKYHQKFWFYYHANSFEKPYMILGAGSKRIGLYINLINFHDGKKLYSIRSLSNAIRKTKVKIIRDSAKREIRATFAGDFGDLKIIFEERIPFKRIIGVTYDDPKGPVYCYNSMIADATLRIIKKDGEEEVLKIESSAAFEIGTRKKIEELPLLL